MEDRDSSGTLLSTGVETAATSPRVLVIGLDPYRVPGPWDPAPVADAIAESERQLAQRGVDAESCLVGLDGSDDIEAVVGMALRSRRWDCVVIGGGLREPDDQLELFEAVVNLVHRHAPDATIAFNRNLSDIAEAVGRSLR